MKCLYCGIEFLGRKRKYCNGICRERAWDEKRGRKSKKIKICVNCGDSYHPARNREAQKCCSEKCQRQHYNKTYLPDRETARKREKKQRDALTDGWVKKSIIIHSKGTIKTAQITPEMIAEKREHILAWRQRKEDGWIKREKAKKEKVKTATRCVCTVCGKDFMGKTKKSNKCSPECTIAYHLKKQREKYKCEWVAPPPLECRECGKMHQPVFGDKRELYCSDKCQKRSIKRNAHHLRRRRLKDGFKQTVYKSRIWKRDNYKCQICGKKVALKQKAPHPYSPSLDHIIPLSKGGTHEPKNIRLVHFICNSLKSDNVSCGGDQLLLFG